MRFASGAAAPADWWQDSMALESAEALAVYEGGLLDGRPAVVANAFGSGRVVYLGTRLEASAFGELIDGVVADAGVAPVVAEAPAAVPAPPTAAVSSCGLVATIAEKPGGNGYALTLKNTSAKTLKLVAAGDGSEAGWRTPSLAWTATSGGKPARELETGRCGMMNAIHESEVFSIAPGATHTLAEWIHGPALAAGTYNVAATATGNSQTATDSTTNELIIDTTVPVITLSGSASISIKKGATYTDASATATDNIDGNVTGSIVKTSTVNTTKTGTYYVYYNVTDAAGNAAAQKTRTVKVTL